MDLISFAHGRAFYFEACREDDAVGVDEQIEHYHKEGVIVLMKIHKKHIPPTSLVKTCSLLAATSHCSLITWFIIQ